MSRFAAYVVFLVGAIYSLEAVGVDLAPLLGLIGIFGLAIALALQDIFANFVAGLILLLRRPFKPGDEIGTGDHSGQVEDVNLRSVKIRQPDGVVVFVPNSDVLSNAIINFTEQGIRRTTVEVGVAYSARLEQAKSVIVDAISSIDGVVDDPRPSAFVHEFGDSSMNIAVNFWHLPSIGDEWAVRDRVAIAVKEALDSSGIEIPFPQRVITTIG